jgi:hypothetical protein
VLKAKVSVFVDLYLKRSEPALDQLGAVEETLALLGTLPAVRRDAEAAETAAQLAARVGRLRAALDGSAAGSAGKGPASRGRQQGGRQPGGR